MQQKSHRANVPSSPNVPLLNVGGIGEREEDANLADENLLLFENSLDFIP